MSATAIDAQTKWIPRVAPDGLAAAFMLSVLATAGFFYINIMGAIVSGLVDGLHLSASDAGRVGAFNIYGGAAGAFLAVLLVRRVAWRPAAALLLCGLIGFDLSSLGVHSSTALALVRLLHGLTGGLLVGICYAVMARTRSPDSCFGALMAVQSSLGGLGLMFLPQLVHPFGAPVLFLSLAGFSLVALALLPFLPDYPQPVATIAKQSGTSPSGLAGLVLAFASVFFFQAGNMALSAYIIELGRAYGLSLDFVSVTIGVSGWIATLGALLVIARAKHPRRTLPIALGSVLALLGNAAFHASSRPTVFLLANVETAIVWFFVMPYLLGLCAKLDRTGRAAALAGLSSKLGLATGPYAASLLINNTSSYGTVINLSVGALALAAICGVEAARRADASLTGLEARPA